MTRLFAGTQFDIPPSCDRCGKLEEECRCKPELAQMLDPGKQTAKVRVDRRKHKRLMTVVWNLDPESNDLPGLLSQLKSACGTGGSIQESQIELQGDHLESVKKKLSEIGYKVR